MPKVDVAPSWTRLEREVVKATDKRVLRNVKQALQQLQREVSHYEAMIGHAKDTQHQNLYRVSIYRPLNILWPSAPASVATGWKQFCFR